MSDNSKEVIEDLAAEEAARVAKLKRQRRPVPSPTKSPKRHPMEQADQKERYLVLPPELGDGQHSTVVPMNDPELPYHIRQWARESAPGDSFEVGLRSLTREEYEKLDEL